MALSSSTGASSATCRSTSSNSKCGGGIPIRLSQLPRVDCIPCRKSGRPAQHNAAQQLIRVFVRLPGRCGRVAIWASPDATVGTPPPAPLNRFTELWGHDAEVRGPQASRTPAEDTPPRPRSPVRALLARRFREQGVASRASANESVANEPVASWALSQGADDDGVGSMLPPQSPRGRPGASSSLSPEPRAAVSPSFGPETVLSASASVSLQSSGESLKAMIEAATGFPESRQRLVCGHAGPLDRDERALCDYDVGHGALLYLSLKPDATTAKEPLRFLASSAHAAMVRQEHTGRLRPAPPSGAPPKAGARGRSAASSLRLAQSQNNAGPVPHRGSLLLPDLM